MPSQPTSYAVLRHKRSPSTPARAGPRPVYLSHARNVATRPWPFGHAACRVSLPYARLSSVRNDAIWPRFLLAPLRLRPQGLFLPARSRHEGRSPRSCPRRRLPAFSAARVAFPAVWRTVSAPSPSLLLARPAALPPSLLLVCVVFRFLKKIVLSTGRSGVDFSVTRPPPGRSEGPGPLRRKQNIPFSDRYIAVTCAAGEALRARGPR